MSDFDEDLTMEERETLHSFYQFASLASMLTNKKMPMAVLFVQVLTDSLLKRIAKIMMGIETDVELCRYMLQCEPALVKSKVILQYATDLKKLKSK